jgi:hypothetical protein
MPFLDKIKSLFVKQQVPDETRLLLEGVENVHELRRGLDEIVTRNEVELKEVEREIDKLEKIETAEKEKVKAGTLAPREKENTLKYIKRLRTRMDSYQKRHKIHQDNIDLHLSLLDKIDEMEAMELKAVKQEQIDAIAEDYDEKVERHKEIVRAGRIAAENEPSYEDMHERRELEKLEKEILAEGKPPEEKEAPARVEPEKPEAEKPTEAPAKEPETDRATRAPLAIEDEEKPRINVPTERPLELE